MQHSSTRLLGCILFESDKEFPLHFALAYWRRVRFQPPLSVDSAAVGDFAIASLLNTRRNTCLQSKETRISLLEHHWWSHIILLYHPFIESPNTIYLPSTPRNDYGRPSHFYHWSPSDVRGILRDYLIRAALTSTFQEPLGNRPCGASRRKIVRYLLATDEFFSHTTGQHYKIKVI